MRDGEVLQQQRDARGEHGQVPQLTHVSSPKLANAGMGSNVSPAPKPRTPATRNCTTVSSVMSRPRAYFAVYSTCRLRKNADSSVIRSPKRSENPESPANETQPTPATHTRRRRC